jgi:hypothetical protein
MNSQFENNASADAQRVDLTEIIQDPALSLNKLSHHTIHHDEMIALVDVFDPKEVYVSPAALMEIKRAYLTVPCLIQEYANNYVEKLFRKATRSNDKGKFILDPLASTYTHSLRGGGALVVHGVTVKNGEQFTRRLTIHFDEKMSKGEAK